MFGHTEDSNLVIGVAHEMFGFIVAGALPQALTAPLPGEKPDA